MVKLTAKQESFIALMAKSDEHARKGYELLIARPKPEEFFDAIAEIGLFSPDKNPGPVPADEPGYVRIPYWSALDYLEFVAKIAGEREDLELSMKILDVVRSVSRNANEKNRNNHHTWRKFSEILGLVPTSAVAREDLDLITIWVSCQFDRGLVAAALDQGVLAKFLASDSPDDWEKACQILFHCTAIQWEENHEHGEGSQKPKTIVNDYWLKKLINNHAKKIGERCGNEAAKILIDRIREYFSNKRPSFFTRPAVEDHDQNRSWEKAANALVEGLRDILLSWTEHDQNASGNFVAEMLGDENDMVRRVGIFILDKRWAQFGNHFVNVLNPFLFSSRHIHELYNLLKNHFIEFGDPLKAATIETLKGLPRSTGSDDPEESLRRTQRQWLSAVTGKGYAPADKWFEELDGDPRIGRLSKHPDFHIYMESFSGPGPSPYDSAELIDFAERGTLVANLNSFSPKDTWRGSSKRALVDELVEAVQHNPQIFLTVLSAFIDAQRPYQYGIINGFKKLWDSTTKVEQFDWTRAWKGLFDFFAHLLQDQEFWKEEVVGGEDLTPTRDWIPPIIAEFLQAGTRRDENAYPPDLLPPGWQLIQILLEKSEPEPEPSEDAMTQAINSAKGKAIEALFNHALRVCRIADKEEGDHSEKRAEIRLLFDRELVKCANGNYEFSTLAAAYLLNLQYLDHEWLRENLGRIFPAQYPANLSCALKGLSYAQASRPIYELLLEGHVIDQALRSVYNGEQVRERLVQRICLAYLWGDEELRSPRFEWMFDNSRFEDLRFASDFSGSFGNQELEDIQQQRVIEFFRRCVAWAKDCSEPPGQLFSSLSCLSRYLSIITPDEQELLLAVAPYVNINYNATDFFKELDRLADSSPMQVSAVLGRVFDVHLPLHDYNNHLKSLLTKLIGAGMKGDVFSFADRLRGTLPKLAEEVFRLATS